MTVAVPGRPDVYLERVEIEFSEAEGDGRFDMPAHFTVWPFWAGVDRPQGTGTSCRNRALAERLQRAIVDGVAIGVPEVGTDIAGKTYVHVDSKVLARQLNASLRRLGY